ncbi:extracellular solute-binding protein [Endozoicomonas sp. SM1973]|uniref:Putrescine-binding periplasmic protein n=1 Tax=Spartinivicinus marinus TaxID=2994442 RepID=A0A853I2B7_9GAMM|nr:extracellular solute-binding protein [Spartinivicinus marinus]MCX4029759.1 extracellular solute-binding protein [Spartinivicinus marinus]NYZ68090.1 extracellular solute-binding protein [Spartinivicinus marinus]
MYYLLAFLILIFTEVSFAKTFRILNWTAYIDKSVLEDFGKKHNVDIKYDTFDDLDGFRQKFLVKSKEDAYDIIFPPVDYVPALIERKVLYKLDKSLLSNLDKLSNTSMADLKKYDSTNEYILPYLWGTVGLGINVDKVKKALKQENIPSSWKLAFDPVLAGKLSSCGISYLDSEVEIFPLVLNYLGKSGQSMERSDIVSASKYLRELAPKIKYFDSEEYIERLKDGEICIAIGYSGDIFQAISDAEEEKKGYELKYIIPEEGSTRWIDAIAIPSNSNNPKIAHAFLNYLMVPEVIAKISNFVWYANNIPSSTSLIEEEIVNDKSIYPSTDVESRLFSIPKYELRFQRSMVRYWTRVKCAQGVVECRAPVSGLPGF